MDLINPSGLLLIKDTSPRYARTIHRALQKFMLAKLSVCTVEGLFILWWIECERVTTRNACTSCSCVFAVSVLSVFRFSLESLINDILLVNKFCKPLL